MTFFLRYTGWVSAAVVLSSAIIGCGGDAPPPVAPRDAGRDALIFVEGGVRMDGALPDGGSPLPDGTILAPVDVPLVDGGTSCGFRAPPTVIASGALPSPPDVSIDSDGTVYNVYYVSDTFGGRDIFRQVFGNDGAMLRLENVTAPDNANPPPDGGLPIEPSGGGTIEDAEVPMPEDVVEVPVEEDASVEEDVVDAAIVEVPAARLARSPRSANHGGVSMVVYILDVVGRALPAYRASAGSSPGGGSTALATEGRSVSDVAITSHSTGFIVAWTEQERVAMGVGIRAPILAVQRFDAGGNATGETVRSRLDGDIRSLTFASSPLQTTLVYSLVGPSTSLHEIYIRNVLDTGELAPAIRVGGNYTIQGQIAASKVAAATLLAWADSAGPDIVALFIDDQGIPTSTPRNVTRLTEEGEMPSLSPTSAALVSSVFMVYAGGSGATRGYRITAFPGTLENPAATTLAAIDPPGVSALHQSDGKVAVVLGAASDRGHEVRFLLAECR